MRSTQNRRSAAMVVREHPATMLPAFALAGLVSGALAAGAAALQVPAATWLALALGALIALNRALTWYAFRLIIMPDRIAIDRLCCGSIRRSVYILAHLERLECSQGPIDLICDTGTLVLFAHGRRLQIHGLTPFSRLAAALA
jgi:hypothetical protein